jgi:MFS family permease
MRRGFRKRFAKATDSPVEVRRPDHPTLSDIAARHTEIEAWEARNVGGYRFAKPGTIIGSLVSAVMVILVVTPIPPNWPWDIPLAISAIFTTGATVVCGLLWFDKPRLPPRPELLEIVPFSRAENLQLMSGQPVEPYRAISTCPGCGDISTHLIRLPAAGEPEWAAFIRGCGLCKREWAQA